MNSIKKSMPERIFGIFNAVLLTCISMVTLYPFLYVAFSSISDPLEYMSHSGFLFKPAGFSLLAYQKVLAKPEIAIGYINTLIYVLAGTSISMLVTISFGYVLSKRYLMFAPVMMIMVLITMYFQGGLIPTYLVVKELGMINTRWAVIFPTAVNTFNLIIMRTAFAAVPESLEEAARIDGAGPLRTLVRIIIPLSMPTIAVLILYYASAQWNSWFQAAIYLRDAKLFPLQLYLRDILILDENHDMLISSEAADKLALASIIKYATIMVSTLPILILYPFLQKYFAKGVMIGAVKG